MLVKAEAITVSVQIQEEEKFENFFKAGTDTT